MSMGILGRKVGMTQVFDAEGKAVPVTVIEAGPCPVVEVRTPASGEITEAQWQQGLDRLEQVFREQPPNRTILLKEVVLKNGREPELRIP